MIWKSNCIQTAKPDEPDYPHYERIEPTRTRMQKNKKNLSRAELSRTIVVTEPKLNPNLVSCINYQYIVLKQSLVRKDRSSFRECFIQPLAV